MNCLCADHDDVGSAPGQFSEKRNDEPVPSPSGDRTSELQPGPSKKNEDILQSGEAILKKNLLEKND